MIAATSHGMQAAATICAIIAVAVAILAVVLLRDIRGNTGGDNSTDLTDNLADDRDRRQPDLLGTAVPVPEC